MKLLYVSCHAILEYDEVRLFAELGIDVFSTGAYAYPRHSPGKPRPGIWKAKHYPELEHEAGTILSNHGILPEKLIHWADVIVYMHQPEYLIKNWPAIRHKRVIFRSIGQMVPRQESEIQPLVNEGLEIVRYSPKERLISNFAGEHALIRFYKDPSEYTGYTGDIAQVITMCQSIARRNEFCMYKEISQIFEGLPHKYYGYSNEELGEEWGGPLEYQEQKDVLKNNRAFVYGGTWPAPYTLSLIEAMMTGIPIIAIGKDLANNRLEHLDYYEAEDILKGCGYVSNNLEELKSAAKYLLADKQAATELGARSRVRAIELFGMDKIQSYWKGFLHV